MLKNGPWPFSFSYLITHPLRYWLFQNIIKLSLKQKVFYEKRSLEFMFLFTHSLLLLLLLFFKLNMSIKSFVNEKIVPLFFTSLHFTSLISNILHSRGEINEGIIVTRKKNKNNSLRKEIIINLSWWCDVHVESSYILPWMTIFPDSFIQKLKMNWPLRFPLPLHT